MYDIPVITYFDPTPQAEESQHASKLKPFQKFEYIDYGITAVRKQLIQLLPEGHTGSMNEVFAALAQKRQLDGLEVKERYREIGSPEGLEEFRQFIHERSRAQA